jgi:hypothetical protein
VNPPDDADGTQPWQPPPSPYPPAGYPPPYPVAPDAGGYPVAPDAGGYPVAPDPTGGYTAGPYGNTYPTAAYPTSGYAVAGVPAYQGGWDLNLSDLLVNPPGSVFNSWFGRTIAVIKRNWRKLLAIGVLLNLLPGVMFFGAIVLVIGTSIFSPGSFGIDETSRLVRNPLTGVSVGLLIAVIAVGIFAVVLGTSAAQGAVAWLVTNDAAGNPTSVGQAIRYGGRRMFGVLGYNLVVGVIAVAGLCACILPGIYLYLALALVPAVYLFERVNPIARSWRLFHGNFGAVLGRVVIVLATGFGINAAFGIVQNIVQLSAPGTRVALAAGLIISLVGNLIVLLLPPFQMVAYVTIYAEQRAREAPLNSAMLAHQLAVV